MLRRLDCPAGLISISVRARSFYHIYGNLRHRFHTKSASGAPTVLPYGIIPNLPGKQTLGSRSFLSSPRTAAVGCLPGLLSAIRTR